MEIEGNCNFLVNYTEPGAVCGAVNGGGSQDDVVEAYHRSQFLFDSQFAFGHHSPRVGIIIFFCRLVKSINFSVSCILFEIFYCTWLLEKILPSDSSMKRLTPEAAAAEAQPVLSGTVPRSQTSTGWLAFVWAARLMT